MCTSKGFVCLSLKVVSTPVREELNYGGSTLMRGRDSQGRGQLHFPQLKEFV